MSDQMIRHETRADITATVIWLHGLGADGHDFVPVVPALPLPDTGVRFLFPHAPVIPVTVNGGMPMRAWYDILAMGQTRRVDEAQLQHSAARVSTLIEAEIAAGIDPARIFVVGFSQGGAVAYHAVLRGAHRLGGLAVLSTYRINPERFPTSATGAQVPVFWAHGEYDDVVPLLLGEQARDSLQREEVVHQSHTYPMGHEVCLQEIDALGRWISTRLTKP
ncbi:alpha/beta hydrolase [Motiliproteus sediminis]|uniref:alpha/beta hydrolase n=1 Tax=Motiliproteus sediminis TaxID=1468178 RepID=UPI001AEF7114|nr:dienelactone hydrolase family protein [Motiliproteus sediminis]